MLTNRKIGGLQLNLAKGIPDKGISLVYSILSLEPSNLLVKSCVN